MFIYIIVLLIGLAGGAICVYVLMEAKHRDVVSREAELKSAVARNERVTAELKSKAAVLLKEEERLNREQANFKRQAITYIDLQNENSLLKQDLRNFEIASRKLKLDRDAHRSTQEHLDRRARELGSRYLKDTVRWVNSNLSTNNYTASKQRLLEVIARCREIGFVVLQDEEDELLANLQAGFEKAVRVSIEREEQARIKARIREEMNLEREREQELRRIETEKLAIQAALARALAEAQDVHSAEVQRLQAKLADAEARAQRAISMAQLTKAGHVYVISNLGSFGDGVFKIGMTRRLEPHDRVRELASASVPFPFDVHMMISCNDAPKLENALHRRLQQFRINRINPRKEFFRTDIETIRSIVEENHGTVEYVADSEALEYRQSLDMPAEDQAFIDQVYESLEFDDGEAALDGELA